MTRRDAARRFALFLAGSPLLKAQDEVPRLPGRVPGIDELYNVMEFETVAAEGYGFQVEMTYRLVRIGGKVVEFPITFRDRTEGISKMSGGIIGEALVLVLKLWVADFGGRRRRRRKGG